MIGRPLAIEPFAGAGELEDILAIDAASFSHPWTRAMYERDLEHPERTLMLVARSDGQPAAGYCACWIVADELQINNVAVLPRARRQGVARALVMAALAAGAQRGARRAWLEVRLANEAARQLYRSLGFTEVVRRPGYYSDPPDDAMVMSAEIQNIEENPGP